MRALVAAVIVMSVLIVAGVATIAVTIVRRLAVPPLQATAATLDEPAGTHLQQIATAGDHLAILLSGGGPDRIVLLDPRSGQVTGRIGLSR